MDDLRKYVGNEENQKILANNIEKIDVAVQKIITALKLAFPKRDLEQIAQMCSDKVDTLILSEEQRHQSKYVGGQFIISYINEAAFDLKIELYFKNAKNDWIQVKSKSQPRDMKYLTSKAILELRTKKTVVFEIDPPILKYQKEE